MCNMGNCMSWGMFGMIVLLIIINAFVKQFVQCMHDMHCKVCKK
jgi:hypothetical protein